MVRVKFAAVLIGTTGPLTNAAVLANARRLLSEFV